MANDYGSIGLNNQFISENSLMNRNNQGTAQYINYSQFDANYEAVSASKIYSGNVRGVLDVGNNSSSGTEPFIRFDGTADRVLYNDGTVNRFFFGNNNGTAAVKLSQSGHDVLNASPDQLIWSSDFNSFKIVQTGTVSVTKLTNQTIGATAILHNQTSLPVVVSYVFDASNVVSFHVPHSAIEVSGAHSGIVGVYFSYIIDTTSITFQIQTPDVSSLYSTQIDRIFRYYLLVETSQ